MGIYLQKSWIILNTFAFLLNLPLYVSATPLLSLLGQSPAEISKAARRFSLWDDPSALCLRRQLRQPQVLAGANQSGCNGGYSSDHAVLACCIELSWLLMLKLGWGMAGGASLVRALMEGFQESQRLRKTLTCLCGHGLVRYQNLSEWFIDEGFQLEVWYFMALTVCVLPNEPSSLCGCSFKYGEFLVVPMGLSFQREHTRMANHGGIWLAVRDDIEIKREGDTIEVVKTIKGMHYYPFFLRHHLYRPNNVYTYKDLYEDETNLTCIANNELIQSVMTHFTTEKTSKELTQKKTVREMSLSVEMKRESTEIYNAMIPKKIHETSEE
ncbi:unnamed protein product [Brassica oleracea var. botrytis]|uniref:Uncharacterized protein n=1 Tax=Brassica oleracea TaxID=3712 RepID=A0A3P6F6L9_BRAOL|nr:unnamed protein product [Brassica oleracea]